MGRGPKRWATEDETALLESFWAEYITKQAENKLHVFWPLVREAFNRLSPPARRLGLPDHNDPKERLTEAELDALGTAIAERNQQIKDWYRNKTKKIRNGAGFNTSTTSMVRKILKKNIDKRQRVHHGREVFAKRNAALIEAELDKAGYNDIRAGTSRRNADDDSDDDDDSNDSDADADAGRKKKSQLMTLRGQVLSRLWGGASAEERVAVEAELNAEKEELKKPSTIEGSKDLYETQKSIDSLDGAMGQILGSVCRETGWGIFAIAAGPNPSLGGELSMKIFCSGETPNGNDFERFCPNFTENIVQPFQDFTRVCFPPAVRHAFAIPTVPLPTLTDNAPVERLYPPAAPAEEVVPSRKSKRKSKKKKTKSPAIVEEHAEAGVTAVGTASAAMLPDPSAVSAGCEEPSSPHIIPNVPESRTHGLGSALPQSRSIATSTNTVEGNLQTIRNDFSFTATTGWVPASGVPNSTDPFCDDYAFNANDANGSADSGFDDNGTFGDVDFGFGGVEPFPTESIASLLPLLNNPDFDKNKTSGTADYGLAGGVDPSRASPVAPSPPSANEHHPKLWFEGHGGNASAGSDSPYRRSVLFDAFRASPVPQTPTSTARRAYPHSAISPQRTSSTTPASTFAAQVVLASIAEFIPAPAPPAQTSAPTTPPKAPEPAHIANKSPVIVAPDFATHPGASAGAAAASSTPVSSRARPKPIPKPLATANVVPVPAAPASTAPSAPLPVPKSLATVDVAPAPAPMASSAPAALPDSRPRTNPFMQTRPARKAVAAAKADEREDAAHNAQHVAATKKRGRPRKTVLTDVTNDDAAAAEVVAPPASAPAAKVVAPPSSAPAAENQPVGDGYERGHVNICHPPARNNTNRINAQKEAAATKRAREKAAREAEMEQREKERKQGFVERIVDGVKVVTFIRTRTQARLPDGTKFKLQPKGTREVETAAKTGSKRKAAPATKQPAKKSSGEVRRGTMKQMVNTTRTWYNKVVIIRRTAKSHENVIYQRERLLLRNKQSTRFGRADSAFCTDHQGAIRGRAVGAGTGAGGPQGTLVAAIRFDQASENGAVPSLVGNTMKLPAPQLLKDTPSLDEVEAHRGTANNKRLIVSFLWDKTGQKTRA
ncbi:hypothetical protein R3P38DRAFT_3420860 [Favolaschia claudopus]|uniref:Uncharacterized protein n=1 Tax=Favolaschia claudopus TaxID=2862362 RepID=A0AAW0D3E5_9AGAR